ncbi:hypothetical protein GCM10009843_32110 [Nocardioides bigeumensis]|uniref:DUF3052 domain-containing protein n=1 Tax=Nocardioides bigeumensis TaxID=433657 RepID=A0ABN2YPK0_9ACTN
MGSVSAPAGYSGTPLPRKLGIQDGHVVLLDALPPTVRLGDLGGATVVRRLRPGLDVTLTFHATRLTLARRLPALFERTVVDGAVWVCWPKKAAHRALAAEGVVVDLDENVVRGLGLGLGWVDVKVAAVDETWSALKFVRRLVDR